MTSSKPPEPLLDNQPSRNPADDGSLTGMLANFKKKTMQGMDNCLPAIVIAYDRASNRATVQPMIKMVGTDGKSISRAQIASVPVFQIAGGGFMLNFPIKAGDLGWIKAVDRDISLYLQASAEQQPNTNRMHSFNNGFFLPQTLGGYTIYGADTDSVVLSTLDGSTRIAVSATEVTVTATDKVTVNAPEIVLNADTKATVNSPEVEVNATTKATVTSPDVEVTASGSVSIDSPTVTMSGNLTVAGTITGTTNVIAGTKSLKAHTHGTGTALAGTIGVNN